MVYKKLRDFYEWQKFAIEQFTPTDEYINCPFCRNWKYCENCDDGGFIEYSQLTESDLEEIFDTKAYYKIVSNELKMLASYTGRALEDICEEYDSLYILNYEDD